MNSRFAATSDLLLPTGDGFPAEELFAAATTAVLMAEESTGRVVAINPAAQRLLGISRADLVGRGWHHAFSDACAGRLLAAARQADSSGHAVQVPASGSTPGPAMTATLSTFCVSKVRYLLVRLAADVTEEAPAAAIAGDLLQLLDTIAVGFVVTDGAFCIEFVNQAFLDIVNQPTTADVQGQCLLRWLNLTQADLTSMQRQMASREAGSLMTTRLRVGTGPGFLFEVTALAVPDAECAHWGFVVRKVVPH